MKKGCFISEFSEYPLFPLDRACEKSYILTCYAFK